MNDEELLRYSRQIMLPDFDIEGQDKLLASHVLIVGLGGLGSPAALYLGAAGIGHMTLVDDDTVELSNLQRQIAHDTSAVGSNKAESAAKTIYEINPGITVDVLAQRLDEDALRKLLAEADIVLDCTDNFETRYILNDLCWAEEVPLVSGAAIRWEGQVSLFDPKNPESPCYRCLYPTGDSGALNCSENGVIAPLVGIIGTCQALEAIKHLSNTGESLAGHILYFDGKYMEWRKLRLTKNPQCSICA